MSDNLRTHFRTCNLCEAMCGLVIKHDGKKVHSIKGDPDDHFSKGFICPKAVALQDIYEDPDRLRKPVKKTANGFVEISWQEAFDTIEKNVKSIIEKHGEDSFGVYQGNPNVHNYGTMLFGPHFVRTIRTKNRFSATSIDQLPHHFAAQFMLGHASFMPIPDINRTDFFLVLGGNPLISNGSIMTAAGMPGRLKALKARGGKMVVVDPRKTETALKADQHIFIKPATDVLLLLALIHTIYDEGLDKPGRLVDFTDGLNNIPDIVKNYSPEKVKEQTGVDAGVIRELARDFANAKSAVCYGRLGVSVQEYGSLCQWLVNVLNIVTGNFDKVGGAMFTSPAFDSVKGEAPKGTMHKFDRWKSRVSGMPEFGSELPCVTMAEEMTTPGEGQIKVLFTSAGNPVLSTPNGEQLDKAMESLDFMFSVDIYINETTRHADIILPPATGLETDHFDVVFNTFAVSNVAKFSSALFEPSKGAKYDWEIFKELARRFQPENSAPLPDNPLLVLDASLRYGPYGKQQGLTLEKLQEAKHGLDLGPLKPCLPERLFTPEKRIDLCPALLVKDLDRMHKHLFQSSSAADTLLLIGRRHLRSNNSWMHNSKRLVKGPERCTLMMNPSNANELGLENQQLVAVSSRVGKIEVKVEITDEVMPGVVSLPHGWGHKKKGSRMKIAEEHAGVNVNILTDHKFVDSLTGNAAVNGVPVEVAAC